MFTAETSPLRRIRWSFLCFGLGFLVIGNLGCSHRHDEEHADGSDHHAIAEEHAEPWSVTAWGELYEIFPEVDPLVAGQTAVSHTHVTILAGFAPLAEGEVAIVLRGDGVEEVFAADKAKRPGIFSIEVTPQQAGERELLFRIDGKAGREEIAGGQVRVGNADDPGGLLMPPPRTERAVTAASAAGGEEISFLKEQQWKTPFATEWTEESDFKNTRVAPARLTPRPGGDRILTAPADGVVLSAAFPYPGLELGRGARIFALSPRLDPERSLAALEGELQVAEAELALATADARRARELATGGVLALAAKDQAEATLAMVQARVDSLRRDLETTRQSRGGRGGSSAAGEVIEIAAPFAGSMAAVGVSAGQAVEAGDELGRFVAGGPPWIEAWLPPEAAELLKQGPTRISLRIGGEGPTAQRSNLAARVVAISPALDPASGRRTVLIELAEELAGLAFGQSLEVEIESASSRRGIVVPAEAIIDDAGSTVVYVQVEGESLRSREVRVLERAGTLRLVAGLAQGERIVTLGGAAVRRSTLISSGVGEGHVH